MRRILEVMTGPPKDPKDPKDARAAMVDTQLRKRGVSDERVLAAMGAIRGRLSSPRPAVATHTPMEPFRSKVARRSASR